MKKFLNLIKNIAPFTEKYITDIKKRTELFLRLGLAVNVGYSVFNIFTGVFYRSVWFGAVAVYYIMLCFIKFFILRKGFEKRGKKEYSDLLTCGIMLFILSVAVTAIIYIMIWKNEAARYGRYVIYISAAYTLFRICAAFLDAVRLRHLKSPTLYAAKALSLSVALTSLFSLQFSVLDILNISNRTRYFFNVISGSVVGVLTIAIAVLTIRRAYFMLKENKY